MKKIHLLSKPLFAILVLFLIFTLSGCKSDGFTIQFQVEVPNLQFIETRSYFNGEVYTQSRLRESNDALLEVGNLYEERFGNSQKTPLDSFDLSSFQIQVYLLDQDMHEYASSEPLSISVEYGKVYTVTVGVDPENKLTLKLD